MSDPDEYVCDVCGEPLGESEGSVEVDGLTFAVCSDECSDALVEAAEEPEE